MARVMVLCSWVTHKQSTITLTVCVSVCHHVFCHHTDSLVPQTPPSREEKGLVTIERFLGCADSSFSSACAEKPVFVRGQAESTELHYDLLHNIMWYFMVVANTAIWFRVSKVRLWSQHNQENAQYSPDPFPLLRAGSGHETTTLR